MTTANSTPETAAILSEPEEITLAGGRPVLIQRLKTIQMLRLLRVFTKGIGTEAVSSIDLDGEPEELVQNLLLLSLMAVPEAEEETIEFVQSLVLPVGLIKEPKSKADREANQDLLTEFFMEMQNPELDDLISILEVVFRNEAPHLVALGKRLVALLKAQQKSQTAKSGAKKK